MVGEFSIALVLLAAAGLMVRSFLLLQTVDPGFRPEKLLIMRIDLHVGRTAGQQVAYFRDTIERAQTISGVLSAGAISGFLRSDPEDAAVRRPDCRGIFRDRRRSTSEGPLLLR